MRENVSSCTVQSRILALFLVFAMMIGVCPAALAADEAKPVLIGDVEAGFVGDAIGDDKSVFTNSTFGIQIKAAFNEPQIGDASITNPQLRLYIGDMNVESFTSLKSGGKFTGLEPYIADGLRYTVKNDNDGQGNYILIEKYENGEVLPWNPGNTVVANLGVKFDGDAQTGTEWSITPKIYTSDDKEYKSGTTDTVKAKSSVVMNNTKSVSPVSIMLPTVSGDITLGTDLVYEISAFTGTEPEDNKILAAGETRVNEYTVTDTFTLPEGIYISGQDEKEIRDALEIEGFDNYTITNIKTDSNRITGFTISYTQKNDSMQQIANFKGTVKISKDKIKASADFTNLAANKAQITNKLSTSYKTVDSPVDAIDTTPVEVKTDVYRPSDASYTQISKSIDGVKSQYGTYVTWNNPYLVDGDYVLYKISFYNSGDTKLVGGMVTDTLPDGLELAANAGEEIVKLINNWSHNNDALKTNGYCIHNGTANVAVENKTITFNNVEVAPKSWFEAYVLAKITDTVTDDTIRVNTAKVGDTEVSAEFKQKPRSADISIKKDVQNDTNTSLGNKYKAGDRIIYTITVSNKGTADAENVKITDLFPIKAFDNVSYIIDGTTKQLSSTDNDNTSEKLFDLATVTIPANSSKTITITGTIKSDRKDSSIVNAAKAEYGEKTVSDDATLYWDNPASYVTISKSSDKDGQYAAAGEYIIYTITANTNNQTFDSENPLQIKDVIPNGLSVEDTPEFNGAEGMEMTVSNSGQEYNFSIIGNGECTIKVKCKVNSDIPDGTQFRNSAYVIGGNSNGASSGTTYKGVPDSVKAVKTAEIYRNDTKVSDIGSGNYGEVLPGDKIVFNIKVTNTSENDITEFTLHDTLVGKYKVEHTKWIAEISKYEKNPGAYPIHMSIKEASEGVGGIEKNRIWGDWDQISFITNSYVKDKAYTVNGDIIDSNGTSDFTFKTVTDNVDTHIHDWENPDFKIPAGGYIILTYSVIAADTFEQGSNAVKVDQNTTESKVEYGGPKATPTPTPEPGATESPITPAPTVDPDMATLKIEKSFIRKWGAENSNELVFSDLKSENADSEFEYKIKITNTSDKIYKAHKAAIMDQLPEAFGLKNQISGGQIWAQEGAVNIISKLVATIAEGQDYDSNDITWYPVNEKNDATEAVGNGEALLQNWLALELTRGTDSEYSFVLGPNESFTIAYALKLKNSFKDELQKEINSDGVFKQRTAVNTAYFTGDKVFKNTDGTPVSVIAAINSVVIRAESIHPGIEKTAYAYLEESGDNFSYKSGGAHPGARLIWKLKVVNGKDENGTGKTMTNYTLTDILPLGYKYVEGQTYTNSNKSPISYPKNLSGKAEKFNDGKIIKHLKDGTEKELNYVVPEQGTEANTNAGTLKWNFNTADYNLEPGEWIEFLIITEPNTTEVKSGIYYNKAVLEAEGKFYEDTVKVGTVENGSITDGDSFAINTILTNGQISVSTSTGDTATGGTDDNIATGEAGKKVTYTLKVENTDGASQSIKNVSIINRIPYVGDSGVIVSGQRGSQYDVKYQDSLKVIIHTLDGQAIELSKDNYTFTTYSGDTSKVFDENSSDWSNLDVDGWSNTWDSSTKLIRIMVGNDNNSIELKPGEWIEVSYDAILPDQGSTEDTTAWNGFAYHYDAADGNVKDMAAEPASVGVTLPKNDKLTGKISVKKTLSSPDNTPRTFYVAIYDKQYEKGVQPLSVKSITLTGGNVKHPVNAEIEFDNLTYTAIGKDVKYYIYETDENGIPLIQDKSGNGFVMCKGFYRTDKGSYSVVYNSDETNKVDDVTPSDEKNVDMVWATDKTGSNKVEHVITGHYCFWEKGLNTSKRTNSANFTNCIEETKVERQLSVKGPYYSDIATSFEALNKFRSGEEKDTLTTGVVTDRDGSEIKRDERDNNDDADRNITYSYDSGNKITKSQQYDFGNGWGNAEGHTVATGFMATITGGTNDTENTINEVMWDVKSDPINNQTGVYVKLTDGEYENFKNSIAQKGYSLTPVFTDDETAHNSIIYRIEKGTGTGSLTDAADAVNMDNTADDEIPDSFGDDVDTKLNENGDSIGFDSDDEVSDSFGNDDYSNLAESETIKPLHWKITDKIPAVTLGNGTTVNIGIIIDQIYDNSAVGEFTINPSSEDSASATSADSAKITPYGPQADVPAYNFSGIYAAEGIKNVLSPLKEDDNIALGKSYFGFGGDIRSIRANTGDKKQVMICAGAYQESNSSGKLTYKNDVTVSNDCVRVGSYNNSKSSYLVSGQPAPAIAVKIPAGGVKLTINAASGGSDTRYLTIYESNGNGGFNEIKEISREGKATVLKAEKNGGTSSINISANSDKVVYITSTGSNINIKSIGVSAVNN